MPFLVLGEVLVDVICEQPADGIRDATSFVPHFGGAAANVAVSGVRAGGSAAVAGGVGQDPWGEWLLDGLRREGVDTRFSTLDEARQTPVAVGRPVCFDPNLRLKRWPSREAARAAARECLPGCLLVKARA